MAALTVAVDATTSHYGASSGAPVLTASSPSSGAAIVAVAAGLLSLNRFGGLVTQAPRAFVQLALVVVWGWIGLSLVIWLAMALFAHGRPRLDDLPATIGVVGRSHVPLVALAFIMFLFAGALQLRWPVLIATIGVVGWWFPRTVVIGLGSTAPGRRPERLAATSVAYVGWIATVGRHLLVQLGHLI